MADQIRVLISEANPGEAEKIAGTLRSESDFAVVGYAQDGLEAAQAAYRLRPDVAVLWEDLAGLRGVEACELIARTAPEVACVLVLRQVTPQTQRLAQAAGARAVLGADALNEIPQTLREIAAARAEMPVDMIDRITDTRRAPLVVTVTGAKGGVGKTTVAVNLAVALASREDETVALVEIPGQLGDSAMFLDLSPARGFLSLLESDTVDADVVESTLVRHPSGVALLAATADNPTEELSFLQRLGVSTTGLVLGTVKRTHSIVVVDCPIALWQQTAYVATRSHVVVVVATVEDVTSIRDTTTLLDLLVSTGIPRERLLLVVNKVARGPLTPEDLARAAGWDGYLTIPHDTTNVASAVNEGVPLVTRSPSSPAARAIAELAQRVLSVARQGVGQ